MCGNNRQRRRELQAKGTGQEPAVSSCIGRRPWGRWRWAGEVEEEGNGQAFGHGDFRHSEKYSGIKNKLLTRAGHSEPQTQRGG